MMLPQTMNLFNVNDDGSNRFMMTTQVDAPTAVERHGRTYDGPAGRILWHAAYPELLPTGERWGEDLYELEYLREVGVYRADGSHHSGAYKLSKHEAADLIKALFP